jgi:hypothetical protein
VIGAFFIFFAALFKSVADTLQHHYDTSIFKHKAPKFWNPAISYRYVKFLPLTKYRPDGWHLANSAMIVCFVCAAVLHRPVLAWYYEILIGGAWFIVVFNTFYNKLLR